MVVPAALQLNPSTYEDPLAFNPWRWQVGYFIILYFHFLNLERVLINHHDHLV